MGFASECQTSILFFLQTLGYKVLVNMMSKIFPFFPNTRALLSCMCKRLFEKKLSLGIS